MDSTLVESAEDVSHIAFGFMASKALFAGLHIDVFTLLAAGAKSSKQIADEADIPMNRVTTLMTALTSVGLVDRDDEDEIYSNSPGAQAFLAKGAKYEFGDYLRYQIGPADVSASWAIERSAGRHARSRLYRFLSALDGRSRAGIYLL